MYIENSKYFRCLQKKNIYICILVVALKVKCVFYIIYPSHVSNHEYSDSSHL